MPRNDDPILNAARAIRCYLPRLCGARAVEMERNLAELLNRAPSGETIENEILRVLQGHPATHDWTAGFLERGHPTDIALVLEKGLQELPGHGEVVAATLYRCPRGDYLWYRRTVGQKIPNCPTHDIHLEAAT